MAGRRVLVVEDNATLRDRIARALAGAGYDAQSAETVAEARNRIDTFRPEALLLDVALPDGEAANVVNAAREAGLSPVTIAMSGQATPLQSFELARLGAHGYLDKPIDLERLKSALEAAFATPPDLEPHVRRTVGLKPIHEVERELRSTMVQEALSRTGGNRQRAASLLKISRQLLQHIVKKLG
ncbi:MAG: response regulator [Myxococcales bacterium]|nr:response regulator [Myxococcales bacterium]MCB9581054.1 response regulator [Polyangiaceae bacterium]